MIYMCPIHKYIFVSCPCSMCKTHMSEIKKSRVATRKSQIRRSLKSIAQQQPLGAEYEGHLISYQQCNDDIAQQCNVLVLFCLNWYKITHWSSKTCTFYDRIYHNSGKSTLLFFSRAFRIFMSWHVSNQLKKCWICLITSSKVFSPNNLYIKS